MSNKKKTAVIAKGNNLIMSHYSFELCDAKLVFLAQIKLRDSFDSKGSIPIIPKDVPMTVRMTREEIIEFLGWEKSHSFYEDLRDIGDRLTSQKIELYEEEIAPNGEIKRHFEFIDPYPRAKYKDGCFELEFSSAIRNELGNFDGGKFTLLDKQSIKNLSHTNALRLYEIFKASLYQGGIRISLDELRRKMFIDAERKEGSKYKETRKYSAFGEFNRSVLKPCIKEINDVTDIIVTYSNHRVGRVVTELEFIVTAKSDKVVATYDADVKEISKNNSKPKREKTLSEEDARKIKFLRRVIPDPDIPDSTLFELLMLANWDNELICDKHDIMLEQIESGVKIKNKIAWMKSAVKENYKSETQKKGSQLKSGYSQGKVNPFNSFPQRDISAEKISELELKKLGIITK